MVATPARRFPSSGAPRPGAASASRGTGRTGAGQRGGRGERQLGRRRRATRGGGPRGAEGEPGGRGGGSGGCGHGGMPRWGAGSGLTRSGPPPQGGQRGGEVGSVLAVGDSGGLEGRRAVAAAAATAKSWRQRVSLS